MNCLICDSPMEYYFSKSYAETPFAELMRDIGVVELHRCPRCGFVGSKTHQSLADGPWNRLNAGFHHALEANPEAFEINQPPYAEQALMLSLLVKNGLIEPTGLLDFAAGYGTLSRILARYFHIEMAIHDPYVNAGDTSRYVHAPQPGAYSTVLNSAMFEHVRTRRDLDAVNALVADNGVLIIHTVVCERVPKDPEWFYLRPPVHIAFHTNNSMKLLMQQWGYRASLYCPKAKCWVLLREPFHVIGRLAEAVNKELQSTWLLGKDGFTDYWKGF